MPDDAAEDWRTQARRLPLFAAFFAPPEAADGCFVLGRLAQSLDGRIAASNGESHWISGEDDVLHTHRLRALSDAIVVGAGTVAADDPQLTTRNVTGPSPVRVILDTNRRLPPDCRVFREGPETILACAEDSAGVAKPDRCTMLKLPRAAQGKVDGALPGLDPHALLAALCARGLRRVFVEGGGITVSRFLAAGALDRLHLTVAPLLLGSGIPAFTLPVAARPDDGLRITWTVHPLGRDLLFDIPLRRARPGICR